MNITPWRMASASADITSATCVICVVAAAMNPPLRLFANMCCVVLNGLETGPVIEPVNPLV